MSLKSSEERAKLFPGVHSFGKINDPCASVSVQQQLPQSAASAGALRISEFMGIAHPLR